MKKLLAITFLSLFVFCAKAQIEITKDDLPKAYQSYNVHSAWENSITSLFDPSGSGQNARWVAPPINYEEHSFDTLHFVLPGNTPYAKEFPNASLAMYQDEEYTYLERISGGYAFTGMAYMDIDINDQDSLAVLKADEPLLEFMAPLEFNDKKSYTGSYSESFQIAFIKVDVTNYLKRNILVDGYGMLTMPNNMDYEVLRVLIEDVDSVVSKITSPFGNETSTEVDRTYYYAFLAKGYGVPLLKAEIDSADRSEVYYLDILNLENISVGTSLAEAKSLKVFPNPASEVLFLNETLSNSIAVLYTLDGKIAHSQAVRGNQINVNSLAKGTYVLNVYETNGKIALTETVIID